MFFPLLAVLITTSAFAQAPAPSPPQQPPPSYRFSSGDATSNIPVELVANGLVFVQAKVNDHPGWFILDNASQGFLVDREYARQIALQTSGSAVSRNDVSDAVQVGIIRDVLISLPGMDLTHRNLVVIDLKSLEPAIGHTVDGILGSRLFDDFIVAVDYERCLLSIYLPDKYQPSAKESPFVSTNTGSSSSTRRSPYPASSQSSPIFLSMAARILTWTCTSPSAMHTTCLSRR
jgi:hypothetical protein